MDQELDELLDSALNDFEIKLDVKDDQNNNNNNNNKTKSLAESTTTKQDGSVKSSVSIERTNLYVDDVDYEDRPSRAYTTKTTTTTSQSSKPSSSSSSSNTKPAAATAAGATATGFNMNDESMKLFEEIFNDEKTKDSMKHFKEAFEAFQGSNDETNLLKNFQKVMSDLVNEDLENVGDDDDFENLEEFEFLKTFTKQAEKSQQSKPNQQQQQQQTDNQKKTETTATTSKSQSQINTNDSSCPDVENKEKPSPLKKVLEEMTKNSENLLKNNNSNQFPFGGDFLSSLTNLMSETNSNDDESLDGAASALMMQPILSMLFSKEILYPSLKLMLENYNKYIEDKKDKLSEDELKKSYEQKECIQQMCKIYEESKDNETQEEKAEQLKKILDLLEKCGMPPAELVPEVNPFEGLGDQFKGCPIS